MSRAACSYAVYVHLPFCHRRCDYCDFFTRTHVSSARVQSVLNQTLRQLEGTLSRLRPGEIRSVYLGGGTPSALGSQQLFPFLEQLRAVLATVDAQLHRREWTIECNPADITEPFLTGLSARGVNRLSVGIQSFSDRSLAAIGRHGSEYRETCLELISRCWPHDWSADLMVALPNQTPQALRADLAALLRWNPPHLSVYELTIEPQTVLGLRSRTGRLSPSRVATHRAYEITAAVLQRAGYEHYEIGNYAREGRYGRHNIGYWQLMPYVGVGPGAVGTVVAAAEGPPSGDGSTVVAVRESTTRSLRDFCAADGFGVHRELLTAATLLREFWMMGLRTTRGVDRDRHLRLFGVDGESIIAATLRRHRRRFIVGPSAIALDDAGRRTLDAILADLFLEIDTTQEFIQSPRFE